MFNVVVIGATGYVGNIVSINPHMLEVLAGGGYIPVVAPIGVDKNGQSYNINADTVAGELASALKAEKLILLTDVEGVKVSWETDKILHALTVDEVKKLIKDNVIVGGMIPKVLSCIKALENGVARTHIIDGRMPRKMGFTKPRNHYKNTKRIYRKRIRDYIHLYTWWKRAEAKRIRR